MTLIIAIFVALVAGATGIAMGEGFDRFVISRGWTGWHMPELTQEMIDAGHDK